MSELTAEPDESFTVGRLRDAAKRLGVRSIQDGSWFRKIVTEHVKTHAEKVDRTHFDRVYPGVAVEERAQLEIRKVAAKAAGAGALASVGASTGELLSLFTDGIAAPIGARSTSRITDAARSRIAACDAPVGRATSRRSARSDDPVRLIRLASITPSTFRGLLSVARRHERAHTPR